MPQRTRCSRSTAEPAKVVARRGVDLKTEPQTRLAEVEGGIMERACYVDERPVEGEEDERLRVVRPEQETRCRPCCCSRGTVRKAAGQGRRVFDRDNWEEEKDGIPKLYPVWGTTKDDLAVIGGPGVRIYFDLLRFLPLAYLVLALIMAPPLYFNISGGMYDLPFATNVLDQGTMLGKLAKTTLGSITSADVGATRTRPCVGHCAAGGGSDGSELCCDSCESAASKSKAEMQLLVYSVLDMLMVLVVVGMVLWGRKRKVALDGESDAGMISMSDYSVQLRPARHKGKPWKLDTSLPNAVDRFKQGVKRHMEQQGLRVATGRGGEPCVWLVFPEERRIKLWQQKVVLLGNLEEALAPFIQEKVLQKQEKALKTVDRVAAKLLEVNDRIAACPAEKRQQHGAEVTSIFCSFEDEHDQDKAIDLAAAAWSNKWRRSRRSNTVHSGSDSMVVYPAEPASDRRRFRVREANEPDSLLYEHLQYNENDRKARKMVANLALAAMLVLALAVTGVIKSMTPNVAFIAQCENMQWAAVANGTTICDGMNETFSTNAAARNFYRRNRKRVDQKIWPARYPRVLPKDCIAHGPCCPLVVNGSRTLPWYLADQQDCMRLYNPQTYNAQARALDEPEPAMQLPIHGSVEAMCYHCVCECSPTAQQACPLEGQLKAEYCRDHVSWTSKSTAYRYVSACIITGFNTLLKFLLEVGARYEKPHTHGDEYLSLATKVGVAQFFNTAIATMIISADIKLLESLKTMKHKPATAVWYASVCPQFVVTMGLNVVLPPLVHIGKYAVQSGLHALRVHVPTLSWGARSQSRLNAIYTYPEWKLASSYGEILFVSYTTMLLCTAIPMLLWVAAFGMFLKYWGDKWAVLRAYLLPSEYKKPPLYGSNLFDDFALHFFVMLTLHLAVAVYLLSRAGQACPSSVKRSDFWKPHGLIPICVLVPFAVAFGAGQLRQRARSPLDKRMSTRRERKEAVQKSLAEREIQERPAKQEQEETSSGGHADEEHEESHDESSVPLTPPPVAPLEPLPGHADAESQRADEHLPSFSTALWGGMLVNPDDDYELDTQEALVEKQVQFQRLFARGTDTGKDLSDKLGDRGPRTACLPLDPYEPGQPAIVGNDLRQLVGGSTHGHVSKAAAETALRAELRSLVTLQLKAKARSRGATEATVEGAKNDLKALIDLAVPRGRDTSDVAVREELTVKIRERARRAGVGADSIARTLNEGRGSFADICEDLIHLVVQNSIDHKRAILELRPELLDASDDAISSLVLMAP